MGLQQKPFPRQHEFLKLSKLPDVFFTTKGLMKQPFWQLGIIPRSPLQARHVQVKPPSTETLWWAVNEGFIIFPNRYTKKYMVFFHPRIYGICCSIISYHIISYHITSHHITSHHITSHHIMMMSVASPLHATLRPPNSNRHRQGSTLLYQSTQRTRWSIWRCKFHHILAMSSQIWHASSFDKQKMTKTLATTIRDSAKGYSLSTRIALLIYMYT